MSHCHIISSTSGRWWALPHSISFFKSVCKSRTRVSVHFSSNLQLTPPPDVRTRCCYHDTSVIPLLSLSPCVITADNNNLQPKTGAGHSHDSRIKIRRWNEDIAAAGLFTDYNLLPTVVRRARPDRTPRPARSGRLEIRGPHDHHVAKSKIVARFGVKPLPYDDAMSDCGGGSGCPTG